MKENNLTSIFDNISDSEFEDMLKKCGFDYKKVEPGNGGLIINGERIESYDYSEEKIISKTFELINSFSDNYESVRTEYVEEFDCVDQFVEAA